MTRFRKMVLFLLAGAGILAVLLAVLIFLGPRLVNTEAFREYALTELESRTGISFSYARAEIAFFPRLRVVVRESSLDIPGLAQGKIRTLEANPELISLLRGKIRIGNLLLGDPDLQVRIPPGQKPEKAFSVEEFEGNLSSLLDTLQKSVPVAVVTVRNGRLDLSDGDGPIVSLRELNARVGLPPERMTLSARCASQYWEGFSIESILTPEGLRGDTRVEMEGFQVREFVDRMAPGVVSWLGETVLSLSGRIESKGLRDVKAEFSGGVPALTLRRGTRSQMLRVSSFQGAAEWVENGMLRATLTDLSVDDPGIRLSGELSMDRESPSIEAHLEGRDAEVPAIRAAILALADDLPEVRDALGVIRGGTISQFSLKAGGRSPQDLADIRAIQAEATIRGGTIVVPGIDLTLVEVGGEASLSDGILIGRGLSARLGNSRVREGSLRLGIGGGDAPFHAEFLADADLGELQPILRRLVPDEEFRKEIDRVHGVRGTASGKLILGELLSAIRPTVTLTNVAFAGNYDRLPFSIAILGGQASYEGDRISVTDLRGNVGGSTISGLTGLLDLGKTPAISIRGGTARIALGELYPWIASLEGTREAMKPVGSVRGVARFATLSCEGPLREPGKWRIEAGGSVENLEVNAPLLPGPVTISRGRFRILPEKLSFTDVEASILDTTWKGGVQLRGYTKGVDQVAATLHGGVGVEAAKWASTRLGVPLPYTPKAPFAVTGSTLSWEKGGAVVADAKLAWPGGPDISFSLRKAPGRLSVDPLVIRDKESDVSAAFHLDPGTAKLKYAGTLSRATVEKVVPIPEGPGQRIHGEMEAVLDRGKPARSTALGTLEAENLTIPYKTLALLAIRSISLSAEGNRVRVGSSDLLWDNVPFTLTGTAEFGGETVVADLDVSAGDIDFERLVRSIRPEGSGKSEAGESAMAKPGEDATAKSPGLPDIPVRGVLRLRADSLTHGGLTWRPFRVEADIGEDRDRFTLTEANLCGISTLGALTLESRGVAIELAASATGEDAEATMVCLSKKRVSVTGTYGVSVRVAGEGTGDALVRSLRGPIKLELKEGRINKMPLLAALFSYLNVTELLRGSLPDLGKEGFPYRTFAVHGEMKDGKFLLEEATIDAPSMGISATGEVDLLSRKGDLRVLVSPLRTVDAVVRKIPVLRDILRGTLVSIPVAVRGDIDNPRVTPMDPGAVGEELLGIVGRTLNVPVHIISPTPP